MVRQTPPLVVVNVALIYVVSNMKKVIWTLEEEMLKLGAIRGLDMDVTEDMVWNAVKVVVKEKKLRVRSEVLIPMRHALTGGAVCLAIFYPYLHDDH
jgi:hypothetical protein